MTDPISILRNLMEWAPDDLDEEPSEWTEARDYLASLQQGCQDCRKAVTDMHAINSEYQNIEDALFNVNITDHDAETSWNGMQIKNIEAATYKIGQITKKYI